MNRPCGYRDAMSEPTPDGVGQPEEAPAPAYVPPKVLTRPASVTVLVILMWISIAASLFIGFLVLIFGIVIAATSVAEVEKLLIQNGMSIGDAVQIAPVLGGLMIGGAIGLFIVSVLTILLAIFVAKGSNVARILLTIIVAIRILSSLATLSQGFRGGVLIGVVLEVALDVVLLWLMYNASARRYFSDRVPVG